MRDNFGEENPLKNLAEDDTLVCLDILNLMIINNLIFYY